MINDFIFLRIITSLCSEYFTLFLPPNSCKRVFVDAPKGLSWSKKMKKLITTKTRKTNKKMKTTTVETSKTMAIAEDVSNKRVSKKKLIMDL